MYQVLFVTLLVKIYNSLGKLGQKRMEYCLFAVVILIDLFFIWVWLYLLEGWLFIQWGFGLLVCIWLFVQGVLFFTGDKIKKELEDHDGKF